MKLSVTSLAKACFRFSSLALVVGGLFTSAQANIVDSADVAGFKTFQDLNTGRTWLDINNSSNKTLNQMTLEANAAGFTFASKADVTELLNSLPLTNNEWTGYNDIMRGSASGGLIWGAYDDGDTIPFAGYAYAYDNMTDWSIGDNLWSYTDSDNRLGIFAYQSTSAIPEPSTYAAIFGVLALGAAAYRRRQARA